MWYKNYFRKNLTHLKFVQLKNQKRMWISWNIAGYDNFSFQCVFYIMLNCKHVLFYMRGKCIINWNFIISNFLWLFTSLWLFWQFLRRIIFSGENLKYQYVYFRTLKTSFIRFMSFPSMLLSINFHFTTFKGNGKIWIHF